MNNSSCLTFPSGIKEFHINNAGTPYSILIPQNEEFRIHEIFNKKEYYVPGITKMKNLNILDVGGNVGLFSMFMKFLCPSASINCYEPAPNTYELLKANISQLKGVNIHKRGLADFTGKTEIHINEMSTGQTSIKTIKEGSKQMLETIRLVEAQSVVSQHESIDIMKIDTEGCECDILQNLKDNNLLERIKIIMLEYHSEKDRRQVDQLLEEYTVFAYHTDTVNLGLIKFVRTELLNTDLCREFQVATPF